MSNETITIKLDLPRRLHKRGKAHAERLGLTLQQFYLQGARNHADCEDELLLDEQRAGQVEAQPQPEP